ncbi:MAG: hypothetical protein KGV44_14155 [Flavobacteriaceae bacterium]|nr:hypothetical protein [Flavobacteriaceae bacterium]
MNKSLTLENLQGIYNAMQKITEIDRSHYFTKYLEEVKWRIDFLTQH